MRTTISVAILATCLPLSTFANASDMQVKTWYDGCEAAMTTNAFELAAGEQSQPIYLDYSGCTEQQKGKLLVFGFAYNGKEQQLDTKHRVHLTAVPANDPNALEEVSTDGSLAVDIPKSETGCWVYADNTNKRKAITIRLRAQLLEDYDFE